MFGLKDKVVEKKVLLPNFAESFSKGANQTILEDSIWNITANSNPTNNCQLFTIGAFDCLLRNLSKEDILSEVKKIYKKFEKSRLLIDIENVWLSKTREIFGKENIIFEQEYESSNGSDMIIIMISVAHVFDDEEPQEEDGYDDDDW